MAEVIKGATAFTFGIIGGVGVISEAVVKDFSVSSEFANVMEVLDEKGNRIQWRGDDRTRKATITLAYKAAYSRPALGSNFAYDYLESAGVTISNWWISKIDHGEKNNDFVEFKAEVQSSEFITLV